MQNNPCNVDIYMKVTSDTSIGPTLQINTRFGTFNVAVFDAATS
jgi:hypothetical protein